MKIHRPDPKWLAEAMRQYGVAVTADYLEQKWGLSREEAEKRAEAIQAARPAP